VLAALAGAATGVGTLTGVWGTVSGVTATGTSTDWRAVDSPVGSTLFDVAATAAGPHAVGDGGTVLRRGGGEWTTVVDDGVDGSNKTLREAAATADGDRLWLSGSAGRLGTLEVTSGTVRSYARPAGVGSTFHDVAVVGPAGGERVYAATGSGRVVVGGRDSTGGLSWTVVDTGGSNGVTAVAVRSGSVAHAVTTAGRVFETDDEGISWRRIGIEDAENGLYAAVSAEDRVWAGGTSGRVWRRDCECGLWTPHRAGAKAVRSLSRRDGTLLGVGDSGRTFERTARGKWVARATPVGNALLGCLQGPVDVAVGKGGVIVERSG
jgi:hypothetical protein